MKTFQTKTYFLSITFLKFISTFDTFQILYIFYSKIMEKSTLEKLQIAKHT